MSQGVEGRTQGSPLRQKGRAPGRWACARALVLALVALGALAIRVPDLANRPMHADEAVHTLKLRELWDAGVYRYDPNEFHGPTLYYAALPLVRLRGAAWPPNHPTMGGLGSHAGFPETDEVDYRLAPALFGAAMVLLTALLAGGIGWPASLLAALLLALSPSLVFYSRYYIQETFLVCFTLGALAAGWRWACSGRAAWAAAAGVCAGLMIATKETAAISFAAALVALVVARPSRGPGTKDQRPETDEDEGRGRGTSPSGRARHPVTPSPRHPFIGPSPTPPSPCVGPWPLVPGPWSRLLLAAVVAVATASLFLSGFLTNLAGPIDYLRSYLVWGERAGGTGLHRQPWYTYLELMVWARRGGPVWSEVLLVALALFGLAVVWMRPARLPEVHPWLVRFLGVYTLVLAAIYSAVPYKTPWCVLSLVLGTALLAGVGGAALLRLAPGGPVRVLAALALAAGIGHLGWQAHRASYVYAADGRNPYVYSETSTDALDLAERVEALARVGQGAAVQVIAEDEYYWPLPWYLRRVPRVGYWVGVPDDLRAPLVLASSQFEDELAGRLGGTHAMAGYYGLRSGAIYQIWARKELWDAFLQAPRGSGTRD